MLRTQCLVCRDYKRIQNESRACELAYQNLARITRKFDVPKNLNMMNSIEYRRYFLGEHSRNLGYSIAEMRECVF